MCAIVVVVVVVVASFALPVVLCLPRSHNYWWFSPTDKKQKPRRVSYIRTHPRELPPRSLCCVSVWLSCNKSLPRALLDRVLGNLFSSFPFALWNRIRPQPRRLYIYIIIFQLCGVLIVYIVLLTNRKYISVKSLDFIPSVNVIRSCYCVMVGGVFCLQRIPNGLVQKEYSSTIYHNI